MRKAFPSGFSVLSDSGSGGWVVFDPSGVFLFLVVIMSRHRGAGLMPEIAVDILILLEHLKILMLYKLKNLRFKNTRSQYLIFQESGAGRAGIWRG